MNRRTRAGVFATATLVACCSVTAAHATDQALSLGSSQASPDQETASAPALNCTTELDDDELTLHLFPPTVLDTITIDGVDIDFNDVNPDDIVEVEESKPAVLVLTLADTSEPVSVEVSDENGERFTCQPESPEPAPTPTGETKASESPTTPTPTPTQGTTSQTPTTTSSAAPTNPTQSQPLVAPAPPTSDEPVFTDPSSSSPPAPGSQGETAGSEATRTHTQASESQYVPQVFRPYSQNPRYLLPELLGIAPHRGSELLMPRQQGTNSTGLETLPPVTQDELDAIKAELSLPGRADKATTEAQLDQANPDEGVATNHAWWLWAGTAAVIAIGVVVWWLRGSQPRKH